MKTNGFKPFSDNVRKVIIAGGRDFYLKDHLFCMCDVYLYPLTREFEIVSGGAKGADKLGEDYAKYRKFPCKVFYADWDKHGRSAGPIRNKQMAEYADALIAFWDCKSRGAKNMIDNANIQGLEVRIVEY